MADAVSLIGQPPAKKRKLSCCSINRLKDEELLRIFRHLSPYERLVLSEVSRRWNGLIRMPWLDIATLDLTELPNANIHPIAQQCPKLQTICAFDKTLRRHDLYFSSQSSLSCVKLYDCSIIIRTPTTKDRFDLFSAVFSPNLQNANWEELVLSGCSIGVEYSQEKYGGQPTATSLPVSLKRLRLCELGCDLPNTTIPGQLISLNGPRYLNPTFLNDLGHLQNLTCLILGSPGIECDESLEVAALNKPYLLRELQTLKGLRELFLGFFKRAPLDLAAALFSLPRLEILFLNNVGQFIEADFGRLSTKHPALRILVVTGLFDRALEVPARHLLFPNGNLVPKLHFFADLQAAVRIRFSKSPEAVLKIHSIPNWAPLSAFLKKAEIAPIFEGSWIAAQITE